MNKPFFHESVNKEKFDAMAKTGKTWGDLMSEFAQPDWCNYPNALEGPSKIFNACFICASVGLNPGINSNNLNF